MGMGINVVSVKRIEVDVSFATLANSAATAKENIPLIVVKVFLGILHRKSWDFRQDVLYQDLCAILHVGRAIAASVIGELNKDWIASWH